MRFSSLLLVLMGLCAACEPTEFRSCPNPHTDPTKRLYNDVLTELIEQGLMHAYLPFEDQEYIRQHFQEVERRMPEITPADSMWLRKHEVRFQNRIFLDTSRFQTFYLNTSGQRKYTELAELPVRFAELAATDPKTAALLRAVAPAHEQAALDSLNNIQDRMHAPDFQLCTANLLPARPFGLPRTAKEAGTITFSKVVFDARKSKALLAYGWQCGGKCGFAEVLLVEKVRGRWKIKQAAPTWVH